jgi:hypothetical protein
MNDDSENYGQIQRRHSRLGRWWVYKKRYGNHHNQGEKSLQETRSGTEAGKIASGDQDRRLRKENKCGHWSWPLSDSENREIPEAEERADEGEARSDLCYPEKNLVSNKMLPDVKTTRSDAFFRFTVAGRADLLPTPANSQQWSGQSKTMCRRCGGNNQQTLTHILKSYGANFGQMTRRDNKVVNVMRRAIEELLTHRMQTGIGENTMMQRERLSDATRRLRSDLTFIANVMGT